MEKRFKLLISLLVLALNFCRLSAHANDSECISELPALVNARSNHSNDFLSVMCSGTPDEFSRLRKPDLSIDFSKLKQIRCEFEQVLLRRAATPEGIAKEQSEAEQKLKSEGKDWKGVCKNGFGLTMKILSIREGVGESRLSEPLKALEQACEKGTSEDVKASIRNLELLETETCSVDMNSWTSNFTRTSSRKWISQAPPSGMCNLVLVETLECDEKGGWVYKSTRVDSDKGEFCNFQESLNKPMIWSSEYPKPLEMRCLYFK